MKRFHGVAFLLVPLVASCGGSGVALAPEAAAQLSRSAQTPLIHALGRSAVLHEFGPPPDGEIPRSELLEDSSGNMYGTTYNGGRFGRGSVFEISQGGAERVLHSFKGGNDGENRVAGLVADSAGDLYGTTEYGGGWGGCDSQKLCGAVFELRRIGSKYRERVIFGFPGGAFGIWPLGSLLLGQNGVILGTTSSGGRGECYPEGCGMVFELVPDHGQYRETIVYNFVGGTDGQYPTGALVTDSKGLLYGTTEFGGNIETTCSFSPSQKRSCGVAYKVTLKGFETVLHRFTGGASDGANPEAGLVAGANGIDYGVTPFGGASTSLGSGVVFSLMVDGRNHSEKILHKFCSASKCADGKNPVDAAGLRVDAHGNLYGTTQKGGNASCACGNVFMLSPSGAGFSEKVLHDFSNADGSTPSGSVLLVGKKIVGTTQYGGKDAARCDGGCGVVYDLTP